MSLENLKPNNRNRLVKEASKLFAAQGFHATTLKQISRKARANGALVSYYFGSKEGLRDAVISDKLERLKVIEPLEAHNAQDLAAAVRLIFRHIREDENFHKISQRSLFEDPSLKKELRSRLWEPFFQWLSQLVISAAKGLPEEEAKVRTLVLLGVIQQYGSMRCFFKDRLLGNLETEPSLQRYETYVLESLIPEICRV